jgi:superfamily I DNA and/or RNA helicase
MIPLVNIVFPLYYKPNAKFVIAGDPFQIQPITSSEDWKDENIYTLVGIKKFSSPSTFPHPYKIVNLKTQYRSIPTIGNIFSRFTYEGILDHSRLENSQRPLKIDNFEIKPLNIIKFPVTPFDSIYRPKRLYRTPYHIYSAIFTFELTKYLYEQITKNHAEFYTLGVICPYKAQASLIQKLFSAITPFVPTNVEVQIGTIHSF